MGGRGSSSGLQTQQDPRIQERETRIQQAETEKRDIESQYAPGQRMNAEDKKKIDNLDGAIRVQKAYIDTYKAFPNCSDEFSYVRVAAILNNVDEQKVANLSAPLSEDDIISRLGGGDLTRGSCSSAALAYIGNKIGLDVLDFRGGNSLTTFSSGNNIDQISHFKGVEGGSSNYDTPGAFIKKLKSLEKNKEYYIAIAQHAAIVKNTDSGPMYLELQDYTGNGWKPLNKAAELKKRFGWSSSRVGMGMATVIDVSSCGNSDEFKHILGYLNTAENEQKKGRGGYAK